jgi:PAP2 superfamily
MGPSSDAAVECRGDGSDLDYTTGRCGFRPGDWTRDYGKWHLKMPKPWLFDPGRLTLDAPTADVSEECVALHRLEAGRAQREARIKQQVDPPGALMPLLEALQLTDYYQRSKPRRDNLVPLIYQNIVQPIFVFKRRFLRARPSRMCPTLRPMFPKGDRDHPGHPSYPSGHATFAYAWAHLLRLKLAKTHAELGIALMEAAKEVAENREWAGLHYASDTRAGESLGWQIADAIARSGSLSDQDYELLLPGLT